MMHSDTTAATPLSGRFVEPEQVVTHFHIHEGDTVADFGAGSGYFMEALVRQVGAQGVVYACEIQKALSVKLGETARSKGLTQVRPLWCDFEKIDGSKIPDGELDVATLINTLFQLQDKQTAIQEISRTLRSGGKFFIVDWSESFQGLGPQPKHVVSQADATAYAEQAGFVFDTSFDAGDHHYGLAFRKP